jgi:hypothetical protein
MIPIADNEDAVRARYELERAVLDGGARELLVSGSMVSTLAQNSWEFSVEWGKLIFAWWDEEHSQNWRISGYEIDRAEIRLQAARGPASETTALILRDPEKLRLVREHEGFSPDERRKRYARLIAALIAPVFKDARPRISTAEKYAQLSLLLNREKILVIGVNENESQPDIDGVAAAGLIRLARFNEGRGPKQQARRLVYCLPQGRSLTAIERLTLIDASHLGAAIKCFEVDERNEELTPLRPATQDELLNEHPRELRWPTAAAGNRWRERIVGLAPGTIEVRRRAGWDGETFSINGLEFARATESKATFGVAGLQSKEGAQPLGQSNFAELDRLVKEILKFRSSDSPDRGHPFYRLRAEAWLESLLRRDICALDATLDDRFVYSQIPTWRADERSVIDLLTIDQESRLVVIEIKAAEDPQLPLQGLDYWLRVEQARIRKEFEKRGLFTGVEIADRSPLLYLVAPRLRFHRSFAAVARCLAPQIEAYQIGVNANWREGVRVYSKERVNSRP